MRYFVFKDSEILGPLEAEEIKNLSPLNPGVLVCEEERSGGHSDNWKSLEDIKELGAYLSEAGSIETDLSSVNFEGDIATWAGLSTDEETSLGGFDEGNLWVGSLLPFSSAETPKGLTFPIKEEHPSYLRSYVVELADQIRRLKAEIEDLKMKPLQSAQPFSAFPEIQRETILPTQVEEISNLVRPHLEDEKAPPVPTVVAQNEVTPQLLSPESSEFSDLMDRFKKLETEIAELKNRPFSLEIPVEKPAPVETPEVEKTAKNDWPLEASSETAISPPPTIDFIKEFFSKETGFEKTAPPALPVVVPLPPSIPTPPPPSAPISLISSAPVPPATSPKPPVIPIPPIQTEIVSANPPVAPVEAAKAPLAPPILPVLPAKLKFGSVKSLSPVKREEKKIEVLESKEEENRKEVMETPVAVPVPVNITAPPAPIQEMPAAFVEPVVSQPESFPASQPTSQPAAEASAFSWGESQAKPEFASSGSAASMGSGFPNQNPETASLNAFSPFNLAGNQAAVSSAPISSLAPAPIASDILVAAPVIQEDEVIAKLAKPTEKASSSESRAKGQTRRSSSFLLVAVIMLLVLAGCAYLFFQNPKKFQSLMGMAISTKTPASSENANQDFAASPSAIPISQTATPTSTSLVEQATPGTVASTAITEPNAATPDPSQQAIDLVKGYPLDGDRRSVAEWLQYSFTANADEQNKEDWTVGAIDATTYLVQYRVTPGPKSHFTEPITYLFETDISRQTVKGNNPAARELLAGISAAPQLSQPAKKHSKKHHKVAIRAIEPEPMSAPNLDSAPASEDLAGSPSPVI